MILSKISKISGGVDFMIHYPCTIYALSMHYLWTMGSREWVVANGRCAVVIGLKNRSTTVVFMKLLFYFTGVPG